MLSLIDKSFFFLEEDLFIGRSLAEDLRGRCHGLEKMSRAREDVTVEVDI